MPYFQMKGEIIPVFFKIYSPITEYVSIARRYQTYLHTVTAKQKGQH